MPAGHPGLQAAVQFPLIEALHGRRARRFGLGFEIPDGPLAYKSRHAPQPLDPTEQMLVLASMAGNTGWHHMITRNERYAPQLANYSAAAGGRTFPSAAGFHTCEFFYTDDEGVYLLPTRDSGALLERNAAGEVKLQSWLDAHRQLVVKLADGRLNLPPMEPYMEGHNTWCVNRPGTTMVIPVTDVAQHLLLILCFLTQNGYCIFDDLKGQQIPGMEEFKDLVDVEHPYPLSFVEQYAITESTAECTTSCYAGMLMLQALGLGGWMFDGLDRFSVLGASGNPEVPGLGFEFQTREDWPLPHVTGRPGVFTAYTYPHYPDMRAAVRAVTERKFGGGGPFNKDTPGPWKESSRIRSAALFHDEHFQACVALQAQYILDSYGKFPATVPAVFILTYLQAQHIDLDFYDKFFKEHSYLETQRRHMEWWHGA
ncbi:hypothetical protein IT575_01030 [bacterium]|nr:hypothetical protein [bacterium]